ncbi:hypothetical protein [Prescottella subtropica]|nr:hypothetical protein [Prescottella subtropica]
MGSLAGIMQAFVGGLGSMAGADGLMKTFLGSVEGSLIAPPPA